MKSTMKEHIQGRQSVAKPPFTLRELKAAIPKRCFERSAVTSLRYLAIDLFLIYAAYLTTHYFFPFLQDHSSILFCAGVALYWTIQGLLFTSIWVIAHECGHHAFSQYRLLNDCVGLILHSLLLVPYFSWRYSHARHHSRTGHLTEDEVFLPQKKEDLDEAYTQRRGLLSTLFIVGFTVFLGWPLYLLINIGGPEKWRGCSHFNPFSKMFLPSERLGVFVSDIGVACAAILYGYWVSQTSFLYVMVVYGVPYFLAHFWLITITLLHHNHQRLPHFDHSKWNWLQGALATVDRSYGYLDVVLHHITDTHVVHHIFPKMPHYHAQEATAAIRPLLGDYYTADLVTPWYIALYNCMAEECLYVQESTSNKGVFWFNDLPLYRKPLFD